MAAPDPDRLTDALAALLTASVAALASPPARQYISAGEPAVDCEMVAVWASSMESRTFAQGADLPAPSAQERVRLVTLNSEVHRKVCAASEPTAAQLDADGRTHAADGWALFAGLIARIRDDAVFAALSPEVRLGSITAAELAGTGTEGGGLAGWRIILEVHL